MEMAEDANSGKTAGGNEKKMDIEQLLAQGHSVRIYPQGYSMYPMLVPGRDEAVIGPLPQGRGGVTSCFIAGREAEVF